MEGTRVFGTLLIPVKFRGNSSHRGSLDSVPRALTDHVENANGTKHESNWNLREVIRFEIGYITEELDYHCLDTLASPYREGLIDFQVKGSLLRCNYRGTKMIQEGREVNACLTPEQKNTLNLLFPRLSRR